MGFPALRSLSLAKNRIDNWAAIDTLNSFPCLQSANLDGNPIVINGLGPRQARQLVIARVGNLRVLNNSEIRPAERRDAERAYVKMVLIEEGKAWTALDQEARAIILRKHPRTDTIVT